MKTEQLDDLARSAGTAPSRRQALRALVAGLAGLATGGEQADAQVDCWDQRKVKCGKHLPPCCGQMTCRKGRCRCPHGKDFCNTVCCEQGEKCCNGQRSMCAGPGIVCAV